MLFFEVGDYYAGKVKTEEEREEREREREKRDVQGEVVKQDVREGER